MSPNPFLKAYRIIKKPMIRDNWSMELAKSEFLSEVSDLASIWFENQISTHKLNIKTSKKQP